MTARQQRLEMKREVRASLIVQSINRRCASIYRNQVERAAKLNVPGPDYSADALKALVIEKITQGCCYCGKKLTPKNFELDHLVPIGRGGSFTMSNLAVCCRQSNRIKGQLTANEFHDLMHFLLTLPTEAQQDIRQRLGIGGKWLR